MDSNDGANAAQGQGTSHHEEGREPIGGTTRQIESDTSPTSTELAHSIRLGIVIDRPKYKHYSTFDVRLASFNNWPTNKTQSKRDMAEAGFAYTGVGDSVRCFFCNIGLKDWPYGACPWEQHIIANAKCGHVIQCKGRAYIRKILGEDLSDSDVEDTDDVIDTVQLAINRNKNAVAAAKDFCSDEFTLKLAVKQLIKENLHRKFSAVELVKTIEEIKDQQETDDDSVVEDDNGDAVSDTEESDEDETLAEENRQLKEPVTCKICFDGVACIITLPCGHMISCSQCVSALTNCAVCRMKIKGTVRALMAI